MRLVTPGTLTEEALLEFGGGQLAGGGRTRGRRPGDRRRRYLDRTVRADRLRAGRTGRRAGAAGAGRDHCRRGDPGRSDDRAARAASTARPANARSRAASGWRRSTGWGRRRAPNWPRPADCSPTSTRPRKAPASCSTRRGGSPGRAMSRSTPRRARASSSLARRSAASPAACWPRSTAARPRRDAGCWPRIFPRR